MLLIERARRSLAPDTADAQFVLVLRGRSLSTAAVEFCVTVRAEVAYRHAWSAEPWLIDNPELAGSQRGDSIIGESAKQFFEDTGFRPFYFREEYLTMPWGRSYSNPYAPVAFSLKQYAYRTRHGLPVALSFPHLPDDSVVPEIALPRQVRDSLDRASVDSSVVRRLVQRLLGEGASSFVYQLGGELIIEIVWDRVSKRFVAVSG